MLRRSLLAQAGGVFSLLISHISHGQVTPEENGNSEQSDAQFMAETNLVSLDVTVTDQKGRPIDDLRQKDFALLEDGVEQDIVFFSQENRPVSWGFVLDRSASMNGMMREVYDAALHSLEAGTEEDEAFVITFSSDVELAHDFTSDKKELLRSIENLSAEGATALYDGIALALEHMRHARHRKKVLVVVTDGSDNSSYFPFGQVLSLAKTNETLIYAVGFFGMVNRAILKLMHRYARKELRQLTEQTGGIAYFPATMRECKKTCRDIGRLVSRQYTLGYYPKNTAWEGRWRTISVAVGGKMHVVRSRQGYLGGKPTMSGQRRH